MTVARFATHELTKVEFSKNRDTDDYGWLRISFQDRGGSHRVEVGPIPDDVLREAIATPVIPVVTPYEPPRGLVWTGD